MGCDLAVEQHGHGEHREDQAGGPTEARRVRGGGHEHAAQNGRDERELDSSIDYAEKFLRKLAAS